MGIKKTRNQLIPGSVPTIQPQRPKELPEARKRTMESDQGSTLQDTAVENGHERVELFTS